MLSVAVIAASVVSILSLSVDVEQQKLCDAPETPKSGVPGGGLPFVLDREAADALDARWRCGGSRAALARALVPYAIAQHDSGGGTNSSSPFAPISGYRVGMVASGASGAMYMGVNLEFHGPAAMGSTVHGEQMTVALAAQHNETGMTWLAGRGSGMPCGHCRQFLSELRNASNLGLAGTDAAETTLGASFPQPFGPAALNNTCPLLDRRAACAPRPFPPLLASVSAKPRLGAYGMRRHLRGGSSAPSRSLLVSLRALQQEAWSTAALSYAPYTGRRAGVALRARTHANSSSGDRRSGGNSADARTIVVGGGVIESVAYNPTLPPLQVALAALLSRGVRDWGLIEEAVLVEEDGGRTSLTSSAGAALGGGRVGAVAGKCVYCYSTEALMRAIAPNASLHTLVLAPDGSGRDGLDEILPCG